MAHDPRPLTPSERAGYRLACRMLALWAAQIQRNAAGLATAAEPDPELARNARFARALAESVERAEPTARMDPRDDLPGSVFPLAFRPGAARGRTPAPATPHARPSGGTAGQTESRAWATNGQ